MRRVILTCGPMGAGKSTYSKQRIANQPGMTLMSRDAILLELFGKIWLDPYTGGHQHVMQVLWERVAIHFQKHDNCLILDTWNGSRSDRERIVEKLRTCGADWVGAWYFVTPLRTAWAWYTARESQGKDEKQLRWLTSEWNAQSYTHDYQLFHSHGVSCEQGFDKVVIINPLQFDLFLPALM